MWQACASMLWVHHTPVFIFFFFNDTATTEIYTLSLHDALPIYCPGDPLNIGCRTVREVHEQYLFSAMSNELNAFRQGCCHIRFLVTLIAIEKSLLQRNCQ